MLVLVVTAALVAADNLTVTMLDNLVAVDGKGGHVEAERVGSAVIISARAMWKAKVDSAP